MGFSKMLELLQEKNKGYIILANAGAFYLARGKDAVIMFEIELENKSKIKVIGYNKITDKCYKELEKEDTIWIEGRIEEKQIEIKQIKINNVELINDSGSNALKNIDNIDIAVVGGSGRELEDILEIIDSKLNSKGRIIITAILVDTKIEAINKLKKLNYNPKIMEINISKGRVLDRGVMMISENPIAVISASKR